MPVFMFWNVGKNALSKYIANASLSLYVDFVILAECAESSADILKELNLARPQRTYWEFTGGISSLKFFTCLPPQSVRAISDNGRVSIRSIEPPLGPSILVAAAHLRSKLQADDEDQHEVAMALNPIIREAEKAEGHQRTIIIGDLNMDPFDRGMISANGLHAVMDKRVALKRARTVLGKSYDYFYNPMWSRMGDESRGPPGTYFLNRSGHVINRFWSSFDQVLLRPDLLPFYDNSHLHVLDQIGSTPLMSNGVPNQNISDHLPIVIDLQTEQGVS